MLKRKIEKVFERFYNDTSGKALLLTGARQVGKTFSVRNFAAGHYDSFVEINFISNKDACKAFKDVVDVQDLLLRISALTNAKLIPGKTLIFFDEVQVCPEIITYIKFLVEDGQYRYILSGSLLGVELKNIRSVPVGYMTEEQMFPLDFEEFIQANGVSEEVIAHLRMAFDERKSPDPVIHKKMMKYHFLYLITGGMPAVIQKYIDTNDLQQVYDEQRSIVHAYLRDITQYDENLNMHLRYIFSIIPSELNKKNKRFYLKNTSARGRFDRAEADFIWLKEAGVAIPVFNVDEPKIPLELAKKANLFKFFMSDTGLLCSLYSNGIQLQLLNGEADMNFGAVYENFAAQELTAHGFETVYYYNSKKYGEVDFLLEHNGLLLPIEIKSGEDYTAHAALNNLLEKKEFNLNQAYVFCKSENVVTQGKITYFPIYFLTFLVKNVISTPLIYRID